MARRQAKRQSGQVGWAAADRACLALPALYLLAALIGSLIPVNRGWTEPEQGTTVYLADNGIHADIIMPVKAQGLDWAPLIPKRDFADADPDARWIAFGSGEERVYLDTPDLVGHHAADDLWSALTGGRRVMHVEYVPSPATRFAQIRLRPEEYRRLWAAIRADFALDRTAGRSRIDHPGYGPCRRLLSGDRQGKRDPYLQQLDAHRLRLAGVKTSLWPPFVQGLVWRYRKFRG